MGSQTITEYVSPLDTSLVKHYEDDFEQLYPLQETVQRLKSAIMKNKQPSPLQTVPPIMEPPKQEPGLPLATSEKELLPRSSKGQINPQFLLPPDPAEWPQEPEIKLKPLPEDIEWETIRAMVEKAVETHLQNQQPTVEAPPETQPLAKNDRELTKEELLNWRPNAQAGRNKAVFHFNQNHVRKQKSFSTPPHKQKKNPSLSAESSTGTTSPPSWQFKPFSFQEQSNSVQSGRTKAGPTQHQPVSVERQHHSQFAMVTSGGHVSYHNNKIHHDVSRQANKGGKMVDLSGYKDLTKPPISSGDGQTAILTQEESTPMSTTDYITPDFAPRGEDTHHEPMMDVDSEYSGNVKTLVQLVSDLPEGVTKQTGAQIIRLTMEAMGISMESVLSEAQAAQSEMLDAVRANIKKIEEYKTIIRKLESEIRYHQGKANELSEIIDLFILSNASPKTAEVNHLMD